MVSAVPIKTIMSCSMPLFAWAITTTRCCCSVASCKVLLYHCRMPTKDEIYIISSLLYPTEIDTIHSGCSWRLETSLLCLFVSLFVFFARDDIFDGANHNWTTWRTISMEKTYSIKKKSFVAIFDCIERS